MFFSLYQANFPTATLDAHDILHYILVVCAFCFPFVFGSMCDLVLLMMPFRFCTMDVLLIVLSMLIMLLVAITLWMVRKLKLQVDGIERFEYELLGRVWYYDGDEV